LQEIGTKATASRKILADKLGQIITNAAEEVYGSANITSEKPVGFQIYL